MPLTGEAKKKYQRQYMHNRYWRLKGATPPMPKTIIPTETQPITIAQSGSKFPIRKIIEKHERQKHGLFWRLLHK